MKKFECGCWIDGSAQHTCEDCQRKLALNNRFVKEAIKELKRRRVERYGENASREFNSMIDEIFGDKLI